MPEMQKECVSVRSAKRSSGVSIFFSGWKRQRLSVYLLVFSTKSVCSVSARFWSKRLVAMSFPVPVKVIGAGKVAVRVELLARHEVLHLHLRALLAEGVQHVAEAAAALVRRHLAREAAEVAHRLEVHALDGGYVRARELDDLAQAVQVDAGDDDGHEQDADADFSRFQWPAA